MKKSDFLLKFYVFLTLFFLSISSFSQIVEINGNQPENYSEDPDIFNADCPRDIISFIMPGQIQNSEIFPIVHRVYVYMPYGSDLTNLIPIIAVSPGATINYNGVPRNFSSEVIYSVSLDGCPGLTWKIYVFIQPNVVTISGGGEFCGSAALTASGGEGGHIYWQNNISNNEDVDISETSVTVYESGTYYFRSLSEDDIWGPEGSVYVNIHPNPVVTINNNNGTNQLTCSRTSISLTAYIENSASYHWSSGLMQNEDNNIVVSPNTYYVTATDNIGCTATNSIVITQDITAPIPGINNNSGLYELTCNLTSISLTATGGATYNWSNGLGTNPNVSISLPNTYNVTVSGFNGCQSYTNITIYQNITPPTIQFSNNSGSDELTCNLTSITLNASGGASYLWSTGATTNSINVTTPNTYSVTAIGANGCSSSESVGNIVITQNINIPTPEITNVSGLTELTCTTTSISLTAIGGGTYNWSNSLGTNPNVNITSQGTYYVTVTGANGCSSSASIASITISQDINIPTPGITNMSGSGILTCNLTNINLTATGGANYLWNTGATTSSISVSTPNTYYVTVTGANGCSSSASIASVIISQNTTAPIANILNISASENVLTCDLTGINLTAAGGDSYIWSTGATTNSINVTIPATYTVTAIGANGCSSSGSVASIVISQNINAPSANIISLSDNNDELTCNLTSITLMASGGVSYIWSTGETTNIINVTTPNTYSVTATGANGCTSSESVASIVISQNIMPPTAGINNLSGTVELSCSHSQINLVATGGVSYFWNNALGTNASVSVYVAGTYTVTVTGANGCTSSIATTIIQNSFPPDISILNISTNSILTCTNQFIDLRAIGGSNYLWSTGQITPDITVTTPGIYTVISNGANGCVGTYSIEIIQNINSPIVTITSTNENTVLDCNNTNIILSATGGVTYTWNTGMPGNKLNVSTQGQYTVTATGSNGCMATSTITITQDLSSPNAVLANLSNSNEINCNHSSVTLIAGGGSSYHWNTGVETAGIVISTPGTYIVTVTGANGCSSDQSVLSQEIVNNFTEPQVVFVNNSGTNVLTCAINSIFITAEGGVSYLWNTGSTSNPIEITEPGTYFVTVTGANGCTSASSVADAIEITQISELPFALISSNNTDMVLSCYNQSIELFAVGGNSYSWSNGINSQSIEIQEEGLYTVTVMNEFGCTSTSSIEISRNPYQLNVELGEDIYHCGNGVENIFVTGQYTSYVWSFEGNEISHSDSFMATQSGTYFLTVKDENGCSATDDINVTFDPITFLPLYTTPCSSQRVNDGTATIYFDSYEGVEILWSTGETTPTIFYLKPGIYYVTITNQYGCEIENSVEVGVILGLEEDFYNNVSIYPNPAKDVLYMDFDSELPDLIDIFNDLGQRVDNISPSYQQVKVNVTNYHSGMYFVNMKYKNGKIATYKVIVE
ncbi:MAG: T9SS type A sorting domain-containing protein [Bacteroidales bacterium]|jgi:hypothetical protein|nr:T9SS type A sorting domain-containing protein [Bacteroidales bacterium]